MTIQKKSPSWRLEQWVRKLKCSGSTGTQLESFPDIRVGVDPGPVSPDCPQVTYEEDSSTRHLGDVEEVIGSFEDNRLSGRAKIKFRDRTFFIGYFKHGVLHGFARYFDKAGRLVVAGHHRDGVLVGTAWRIVRGGGAVVGEVDREGQLTGPGLAYLYPDYSTALRGSFERGVLVSGCECRVAGVREDEAGVLVPELETADTCSHTHVRQIGRYNFICKDPLAPDPYESRLVAVAPSLIPGASEGLFARAELEPGTTVAFYNGSRADPAEFSPDTWETNNYRIFDPADCPAGTIDIPAWAQTTAGYCGSLAHKCNHSFSPNAQFVVFDHPKFGLIPCVSTIADVAQGEEITVGYGYDMDMAPDWYRDAWKNSSFGQEGMDYKDWLNCTVKHPLALN